MWKSASICMQSEVFRKEVGEGAVEVVAWLVARALSWILLQHVSQQAECKVGEASLQTQTLPRDQEALEVSGVWLSMLVLAAVAATKVREAAVVVGALEEEWAWWCHYQSCCCYYCCYRLPAERPWLVWPGWCSRSCCCGLSVCRHSSFQQQHCRVALQTRWPHSTALRGAHWLHCSQSSCCSAAAYYYYHQYHYCCRQHSRHCVDGVQWTGDVTLLSALTQRVCALQHADCAAQYHAHSQNQRQIGTIRWRSLYWIMSLLLRNMSTNEQIYCALCCSV